MAASLELRRAQSRKTALPATMLVIGLIALGGCAYQNSTSAEPGLRQYILSRCRSSTRDRTFGWWGVSYLLRSTDLAWSWRISARHAR